MKYLLILIACFILLCTNFFDPKPETTLDVSAGDDTTVTKNDTINFTGVYTSNEDIEIINWYIIKNKVITSRELLSQTTQLQYIAPDSACTLSFIFQAKTVNNVVGEDTVIAYVVPDTALVVNTGRDQTVLIDLPVVLRAKYTGNNIINTFWKIGSDNFVPASPETTFTAPKNPLLLPCIFKITTGDNREAADTVNLHVISLDSLRVFANAGSDTSAVAGSQLTLHGKYRGNNITNIFWKIGNFDFTPSLLDMTISLPDTSGIIRCVLKVTNTFMEALDTVDITVLPSIPLSVLAFKDTTVQAGSQLKVHGSLTGHIQKISWKIGSAPFKQFPPETTITVPDSAMSLMCILKVQDIALNEAVDTAIVTVVDTNAVYAHVGNDTTVDINSSLKLSGSYTGNVLSTFWKIGSNNFIPASEETTIIVPSTPLLLPCIFRVAGAKTALDQDTINVNIVIFDTAAAEVSAGRDTIVPVNSLVKLNGSYTGTNVVETFWNINNAGFVSSSPDTIIKAPSSPAVQMCIFKTLKSNQKTDQDTMYLTTVTTTLQANAGDDQFVTIDSTVQLRGTGKDTVNPHNTIVKYEWNYGDGLWIESADGTGIYKPPAIPVSNICSLRVTAKDGQTATDFCIINVFYSAEASAGKDTIVPINTLVKLNGSYIGSNVVETFWNINNAGFVRSSPDTSIKTPSSPAVQMCIFKIVTNNQKTDQDTMYLKIVETTLQVNAGDDQNVTVDSTVQLRGTGKDTVNLSNIIVKYEWKYGNGSWTESADGTGSYTPPALPGSIICSLRVTARDGQTANDFCIINVFSKAEASAGKDTIVPVNTLVKLNGSYTGTNVVETFWNINNAGFVSSSPDTIIKTPSSPAVQMCIFKIITNNQKTDQDTMYLKIIETTLQANAGDDQNVTVDSTVQLKGTGKDTVNPSNSIVKYEWKHGDGFWIESTDGTDIYKPPALPGSIICSLRVTAVDGQTATDFCIINVLPAITDTNSEWSHSQEIVLNTTSGGAYISDDVLNFPVLIRLNPGNFSYFSQTLAGGADIRFARTDGTRLSYEIERWVDNTGDVDTAEIWVKVDKVYGNNATQKFYMYWGKSDAADSSNSAAVFGTGNNFSAAWHLSEDGDETALDATSANNDGRARGFASTSDVSGIIGIAREFDGSDDYLQINNNILEDVLSRGSGKTTISFWVKADNTDYSKILIWEGARKGDGYGPQGELHLLFGAASKDKPIDDYITLYFGDHDDNTNKGDMAHVSEPYSDIVNWHYVAVSVDNSNGKSETAILYVDGVPVDTSKSTVRSDFDDWNTNTRIGRPGQDRRYFDGIMDEVRIANDIRSEHWIKLCHENQKSSQTLVSFGKVDENID